MVKSKVKITARHRADDNHDVTTVEGGGFNYRREVCAECPWRCDSPVGEFPAEAYRLSAPTAYDMNTTLFGCHMSKTGALTCAGFLLRGADDNLQVRWAVTAGEYDPKQVKETAPLYDSYRDMAVANGVDPNDAVLKPCR